MDRRAPIEKRIAARVRELRDGQELTQAELARLAKTSRSQVLLLERGTSIPSVATVEAFAGALGVGISELVGEEPAKLANPSSEHDRVAQIAARLRGRGPAYLHAIERLIGELD